MWTTRVLPYRYEEMEPNVQRSELKNAKVKTVEKN